MVCLKNAQRDGLKVDDHLFTMTQHEDAEIDKSMNTGSHAYISGKTAQQQSVLTWVTMGAHTDAEIDKSMKSGI